MVFSERHTYFQWCKSFRCTLNLVYCIVKVCSKKKKVYFQIFLGFTDFFWKKFVFFFPSYNSPQLLAMCLLYLISIAFYNFFGLAVTRSLTGKYTALNDFILGWTLLTLHFLLYCTHNLSLSPSLSLSHCLSLSLSLSLFLTAILFLFLITKSHF